MVLDSKQMEWASREGLETAALKKAKVPIFGKWYFPDLPANVPLVNLSTGEVETFPAGFRAGAVLYVKEEDLKRAGIGPYKAAPAPAAPQAAVAVAEPVAAAAAAAACGASRRRPATAAQAVAAARAPAPAPSLHSRRHRGGFARCAVARWRPRARRAHAAGAHAASWPEAVRHHRADPLRHHGGRGLGLLHPSAAAVHLPDPDRALARQVRDGRRVVHAPEVRPRLVHVVLRRAASS